jgi:hypothetical protein
VAIGYDGSIRIDTSINSKGFNAGAKQITNGISGITSSLKRMAVAVGIAFGVAAIVNFGKRAVDIASSLIEVQNVVDTVFGDMSDQIGDFAASAIENFGLSELSAKRFSSTMGAMLKSMGFRDQELIDMSTTLAGLAGDMASFYNLDAQEAFDKLRSGISGETEPLKQLGINLSVANLEAYALSKGITASYNSLSEQSKALLRYNYILSVTGDAQGDFAKTSGSWANQTRILSERWKEFLGIMGNGLIQALTPALKYLNMMVSALINFANLFNQVTSGLFGKQAKQQANIAQTAATGAKAETELAKATEKAGKAAEGAIAGFDDLNVLTQDTADAANNAADSLTGGLDIPAAGGGELLSEVTISPAIQFTIDNLKSKLEILKKINLDNLTLAFENLKTALEPINRILFSGLEWAYLNIFVPLAQWTIEYILPDFLNILAEAATLLAVGLEVLKPLGIWMWENFLQPLATWTGGIIISVLEGIAEALSGISDWISENQDLVRGMTITIGLFFAAWKVAELLAFIQISGGVVGAITAITTAIKAGIAAKIADRAATIALTIMYAKDFVVALAKGTVELARQAAQWVINTGLKIANTAAQLAMNAATVAWNALAAVGTAVTTAFGVAIAFLTSPVGLVVLAIGGLIAIVVLLVKHWDDVKAAASSVWESIVDIWSKASHWFGLNVLEPIKKGFKGAINFLIGLAEGFVNSFITGINAIIRALNSINIDVPDGVPFIGGTKFGISIPELNKIDIPRLATGAVIPPNAARLAIVGDNKRENELIAPESTFRRIVQEELASMGGTPQITVVANGDTAQLIRFFKFEIDKENNRRGKSLIEGVT